MTRTRWLGWALLVAGVALAAGTAILAAAPRTEAVDAAAAADELRAASERLHARVAQALLSRAHALEPRATEAANLPELLSGLDLGADAHTFQDLLETEDWWGPFRSELALGGVVTPTGALAMLGPPVGDPARLDVVRQARSSGTASGIASVGGRPFALAVARVPKGKHRAAGTVVVLGAPIDGAVFQSVGEAAGAAIGLADGRRVVEARGAEPLRSALAALVARQPEGAVALEPGRAGAIWPLDSVNVRAGAGTVAGSASAGAAGLSLIAVFPVALPAPPPGPGPWLALVMLGAGLGFGGVVLLLVARRGRPAPAAGTASAGAASASADVSPFRAPAPYRGAPAEPGAGPSTLMGTSTTPTLSSGAVALAAHHKRQSDAGITPVVMGRYHLLDRVGEGGMAEIFIAATHGVEGFVRHFVVKRMHAHLARNRDAVNQFVDEARLQSGLIHSNIVPVFDFGVAGEEYFMALEYIHGRDLERLVQRHVEKFGRPLSLPAAYYVMHDVLEALAYAHTMTTDDGQSMEIVHRDISPGNILVSFRGEVKLTDFGIAKASWRVSKTEVGLVKGNTNFMSPEQARGEEVDARSDLFSAGVVLHYCLTGQFLYGEDEAVFKRLMRAAAGPNAADLIQMDKVPPIAAGVLRRALALDPAERYQTAREFARDLAGHFTSGRAELSDLMTSLFPDRRREPR